ncbi:TRAP transporter substrate-binding protein [Paracoccus versutus]
MFDKLATTALALILAAGGATAQEQITLRFAHLFPQSHYFWEHGGKVFVEALEAKTDGKVETSVFPAAQLGKDSLAVLQSGLADIVTLVPSYSPDKLPLTSVSELPGFHDTTCEGVAKLWHIIQDGAPLDQAEYAPQGLHPLFVAHQPTYKVLTSKKQVRAIGDLAGLKLRANGAAIGSLVRGAGAVPVSMSSGEVFDAMMRGTVDGTLLPYYTLPIYGLEDVVDYAYEGAELGGGSVVFAMSDKAWQALPDDMKTRFTEAAAEAQDKLCSYQDELEKSVRDEFAAGDKVTISSASETDLAEWQQHFDKHAADWAQGMEKQGRPGQAILDAFKSGAQ